MTLVQFFRILWARRAIIVVAVFACLLAAMAMGKVIPARFKANSRVMLDIVKPDPVTGEIIASQFARAYTKTQIELIRDYRIAGRTADLLGWTTNPQLAAQYQARDAKDTRDFRRWAAQRIIDGTSAQLIEGSNILEISYISSSAQTAAKVADAIRQAYVEQAVSLRREDAASNAAWFQQQSERARQQLTTAETRKSDFERANGIILDADNIDAESKRLAALAAAPAAAPVGGSSAGATAANPMAAQLAQADAAIANASKVLGPNNPDLLGMRQQRESIAAAVRSSQATVRAGAGPTGPSLGALYGAQAAKVLAQRGKVDEARQLATDVAVLRDQYQKTLARVQELQQEAQSSESGLTLLGSATAPQSPSFPNWPLLIFGSIGLGLALGTLVALFAEMLGRRVRGVEDLEIGDLPLLGIMSCPERPARRRVFGLLPPRVADWPN